MDDRDAHSDRPDGEIHASIRACLARILSSDAFRAAPQLSAFLAFIVARAIEGRSAELKGYTIAVEAFGRPSDFDPQVDPIVRVEAGRLRRALAQYYAGEGADDPVRIAMPVGGYVPSFDRVDRQMPVAPDLSPQDEAVLVALPDAGPAMPPPSETPRQRWLSKRWPQIAALALCLALLPLAGWYAGLIRTDAPPQDPAASQPAPTAAVNRSNPRVPLLETTVVAIVVPELPSDPGLTAVARRFSSLMVDALSRFDDLVTIKAPPLGQPAPAGADYVFEMAGQTIDGATESFGRLRSVHDGRIVWSASSARALKADDADLPDIARNLAARLAEPFGIIHADIRQNPPRGPMSCIYQAMDVRRAVKSEDYLAARRCVQDLIDRDPTFYPAWIQLSLLSLVEYTSGFPPQAGSPLERALTAAVTAMRLAPSSARAQQAMMGALFARGATDEALRAGREALARNPYDADIMANLGARFIQLNRPAEGLPLVEKAIDLSAGRPPAYDFFALLGAHLLGAQQLSRGHGEFLTVESNPFALLGRALQAVQKGNKTDRDDAVSDLRAYSPLFDADPRQWLMRRGFGPEVTARIIEDLAMSPP